MTAERENVIDYTVPYYDLVGITILMKKPMTPTSLFKFLNVLETNVWLCILAAYLFTRYTLILNSEKTQTIVLGLRLVHSSRVSILDMCTGQFKYLEMYYRRMSMSDKQSCYAA